MELLLKPILPPNLSFNSVAYDAAVFKYSIWTLQIITIFKFYNTVVSLSSWWRRRCAGSLNSSRAKKSQTTRNRFSVAYRDTDVSGNAVTSGSTFSSQWEKGHNTTGAEECGNSFYTAETVLSPRRRKARATGRAGLHTRSRLMEGLQRQDKL